MSRLLTGLPALSIRTARLLALGDMEGRYAHGVVDHAGAHRLQDIEDDRRLTAAIVMGAIAAGSGWAFEQLWQALAERPTPGGAWIRRVRARRGDGYARDKLGKLYDSARAKASAAPTFAGRVDVAGELTELRALIEAHPWPGRAGASNQRVLLAHLRQAERAGSPEHSASHRQLAEQAGVALSTVQAAHRRLGDLWLTAVYVPTAASSEQDATIWRWRPAQEIRHRLAQLALENSSESLSNVSGHLPAPPTGQGWGVPDTRVIEQLMTHDAFHGHALGAVGLRILAALTLDEGIALEELATAAVVHPATARKRASQLQRAGLARQLHGLYYLHPDIGILLDQRKHHSDSGRGDTPSTGTADQAPTDEPTSGEWHQDAEADELVDRLARAAQYHGTHGAGARRTWLYVQARRARNAALTRLSEHRSHDEREAVATEHIDPATGAGTGPMRGWDCTDPYRPIWRDLRDPAELEDAA